jgi:hypothetical protein
LNNNKSQLTNYLKHKRADQTKSDGEDRARDTHHLGGSWIIDVVDKDSRLRGEVVSLEKDILVLATESVSFDAAQNGRLPKGG